MSNGKIIRDGAIVDNDWTLVAVDGDIPATGKVIVPLKLWLNAQGSPTHVLNARVEPVGVWLDGSEDVSVLAEAISTIPPIPPIPLIAINFPKFTDGRGYSAAALLRTRYGFKGELRVVGDVLRDQLFYLQRVGFNAFAVRVDKDIADALNGLKDFSETYQASTIDPVPLFRRRSASVAGTTQ